MQRYDKAPTLIPRGIVTIGECGKYVLWTDYCLLKVELSDALAREAALQERIQNLEAALIRSRRVLENHQRATPADFKLAANDARSALREDEP